MRYQCYPRTGSYFLIRVLRSRTDGTWHAGPPDLQYVLLMCRLISRTNEGNLLSTREQVRRWMFLNRCNHIMWFDASQVYCTPCDKVIELRGKKHGVYEVYHYVKHWERKHQPNKNCRKKGMTSGKQRRTATRRSSHPQVCRLLASAPFIPKAS